MDYLASLRISSRLPAKRLVLGTIEDSSPLRTMERKPFPAGSGFKVRMGNRIENGKWQMQMASGKCGWFLFTIGERSGEDVRVSVSSWT
jgi:hypothetical protein